MDQILPITPCASNGVYKALATPRTSNVPPPVPTTETEAATTDTGGHLRRSINLNTDVMEEVYDSDEVIGLFLNDVLYKLNAGEYKESVINEIVAAENLKPSAAPV